MRPGRLKIKMSKRAIERMNLKRYGKTGKKPTPKELAAGYERQKPSSE